MQIVLDTNVLLWTVLFPDRLDQNTRSMLQDRANDVMFSAVSIWEIAIKASAGRSNFNVDASAVLAEAVDAGFRELPVRADVGASVATLPKYHRDPFDRLLVAQAKMLSARLITSDALLTRYSSLVTVIRRPA